MNITATIIEQWVLNILEETDIIDKAVATKVASISRTKHDSDDKSTLGEGENV